MILDDFTEVNSDLVQIVRLALDDKPEDIRLYVARLVRRYRTSNPKLAEQLDNFLRTKAPRPNALLRKAPISLNETVDSAWPVDDESRLSLLKSFHDGRDYAHPLLTPSLEEILNQLIQERRQIERLATMGLSPTRSAIFVGQPGVGKTLTARWIASQLDVPLYLLDLTAVMSSLLGRSGSNLRAALDFAKRQPCVLLLDEFDAIAKRRSDDSDVGELKRLVTVILQEVDEWPSTGLLLAATNHPELIDRALWRRFDLMIEFPAPDATAIKAAIRRFLDQDYSSFEQWIEILTFSFRGQSFSDIERTIQRLRRTLAIGSLTSFHLMEEFVKSHAVSLTKLESIQFAVLLAKQTHLSQHEISAITGTSRDTIRKHSGSKSSKSSLLKKI